jgi:hypothetical protein
MLLTLPAPELSSYTANERAIRPEVYMLNHFHPRRAHWLIGLLLVLLIGGAIWGLPALRQPSARYVSVDELVANPDAYVNQYVEVQGLTGITSAKECASSPSLVGTQEPHKLIYIQVPKGTPFPFNGLHPTIVWGWFRRGDPRGCGVNMIYIQVEQLTYPDSLPAR